MASTQDLMTLAGRLATFSGPVQLTKRRASSTKKSKAATTAQWPHESPSPEQLARAGFYYKPSSTSNDSVTCFLCNKSLDGWDPQDDPVVEHLSHVPSCGWAINVSIQQRSQDPNRMEDDERYPLSEEMLESRRATFKDKWPHEGQKGWKPKIEKMIAAGWCFSPIPEAEDCVYCPYCSVSLDGWEPKDDPWIEHEKRSSDCYFFTLIAKAETKAKSSKGKKGRTSRLSKASRISTQSNLTMISDVGTVMDLDDVPADEGDTMLSTMSTMSTTGGGRGRGKKKTATSTVRKTTRKANDDSVLKASDPAVPEVEVEAQDNVEQSIATVKAKTARGRKAKKPEEESQIQPEQSQLEEAPKQKRGKKRGSDGTEKIAETFVPEELVPAPRPTRSKKIGPVASQIESSHHEVVQESIPVMKRGRPVKKAAASQVESSVVDNSYMQASVASPDLKQLPKSKAGRAAKARQVVEASTLDEQVMEPEPTSTVQPPQAIPSSPIPEPSAVPARSPNTITVSKAAPIQAVEEEPMGPVSSPFPETEVHATPRPLPAHPSAATRSAHATPIASPSRTTTAALTTLQPWTSVDLSTIFLQSPDKQGITNQPMLRDVVAQLSADERNMSIESWIMHHASKSESRLKDECERMISVFEENGAAAVRSLGGIVV